MDKDFEAFDAEMPDDAKDAPTLITTFVSESLAPPRNADDESE